MFEISSACIVSNNKIIIPGGKFYFRAFPRTEVQVLNKILVDGKSSGYPCILAIYLTGSPLYEKSVVMYCYQFVKSASILFTEREKYMEILFGIFLALVLIYLFGFYMTSLFFFQTLFCLSSIYYC